jgi:hypothetical protein
MFEPFKKVGLVILRILALLRLLLIDTEEDGLRVYYFQGLEKIKSFVGDFILIRCEDVNHVGI